MTKQERAEYCSGSSKTSANEEKESTKEIYRKPRFHERQTKIKGDGRETAEEVNEQK